MPTKQPKVLDLNIAEMRSRATTALLNGLRTAMQAFDDIDAVERVLNSPLAVQLVNAVGPHTNGTREKRTVRHLPAPKRSKKRHYSKHTDTEELRAAALAAVQNHPDGLTTGGLVDRMKNLGVLDPRMNVKQAAKNVLAVLNAEVAAKNIRSQRKGRFGNTLGRPMVFFPVTSKRKKLGRPKKEPVETVGTRAGITQRLKTFIVDKLIEHKTMSPLELTESAKVNGFEDVDHRRLNNNITLLLRTMAKEHKLRRVDGKSHLDGRYSLVRPNIQVTKSAEVTA